jgi:membrane protein DedA with SNARE-associated domain
LAQFVSTHGVWLVAAFIALETVGLPFPAEAALMAAAIFAASTHDLDVWSLISAGIAAAVLGNIVGFWIGRRFGYRLLTHYGKRVGLTEDRIRIGQWLFLRYGSTFVFIARFLPFLRNMAAILAGANCMPPHRFFVASTTAAAVWVMCYGLASHYLAEAFMALASPVAIGLGLVAILIVLAVPTLILRYEKVLLARAEQELPSLALDPPA